MKSNVICQRLSKIKKEFPGSVTLVAVSKTKPVEAIREAYDCHHRDFGENKVQELTQKFNRLPRDINWHMIGHLQRNKVKYIASFVHLIHAVDNLKLLKEIDKQALKNNRKISILLQIKIAREKTKFGMDEAGLKEMLDLYRQGNFQNINIKGFMGMATNTLDKDIVRSEFAYLNELFVKYQISFPEFTYLSMGMSGDYPIAVEEGSNMIRVGSAIFGTRI